MNEWKESGVWKVIQTRNLGQLEVLFQLYLCSIGRKGILKLVFKGQNKIIHYKLHQDSKIAFPDHSIFPLPSSQKEVSSLTVGKQF